MRGRGPAAALPAALGLALCACLTIATATQETAAAIEGGGMLDGGFSAASASATARTLQGVAPQPDPPYVLDNLPLHLVKLPPGFSISLFANASIPARFFAVGNRGRSKPTIVFVSSNAGSVSIIGPHEGILGPHQGIPTACSAARFNQTPRCQRTSACAAVGVPGRLHQHQMPAASVPKRFGSWHPCRSMLSWTERMVRQ